MFKVIMRLFRTMNIESYVVKISNTRVLILCVPRHYTPAFIVYVCVYLYTYLCVFRAVCVCKSESILVICIMKWCSSLSIISVRFVLLCSLILCATAYIWCVLTMPASCTQSLYREYNLIRSEYCDKNIWLMKTCLGTSWFS